MPDYAPITDPKTHQRARKRYAKQVAELEQIGFREVAVCGEYMFPGSLALALPMTLVMLMNGEVFTFGRSLRLAMCYPLLISADGSTCAFPFGLGTKFYSGLADGKTVIVTRNMGGGVNAFNREEHFFTFNCPANISLQYTFEQHLRNVSSIATKENPVQTTGTFDYFVRLSKREDAMVMPQSDDGASHVDVPVLASESDHFIEMPRRVFMRDALMYCAARDIQAFGIIYAAFLVFWTMFAGQSGGWLAWLFVLFFPSRAFRTYIPGIYKEDTDTVLCTCEDMHKWKTSRMKVMIGAAVFLLAIACTMLLSSYFLAFCGCAVAAAFLLMHVMYYHSADAVWSKVLATGVTAEDGLRIQLTSRLAYSGKRGAASSAKALIGK